MKTDHYKPKRATDGSGRWEFTTPLGFGGSYFSRLECIRAANKVEGADRTCALRNQGRFANVLRPHFFPEEVAP